MNNETPVVGDRHQLRQEERENLNRTWGDKMDEKKSEKVIRIAFQNINGFGHTKGSIKQSEIREFMQEKEIDVYGLSEINVNWRITSKTNSIYDIVRGWFERQHVAVGYNQHDRHCENYLPGGTGILTEGDTALKVIKSEQDPQKLGRWVSTLYRGKNQMKVRVVSVYFPVFATIYGNKKVFCQQQKALLKLGIHRPVWDVFWEDFWKCVDKWKENGEALIIGGDWNKDVRSDKFLKAFQDRDLQPAITGRHGREGPETYNKGKNPIDEIFVSPTIQVTEGGYLEHGQSAGDHRPIWIEVEINSMLGGNTPELPSFQARKLKCHDPRIVDRYNTALYKYLRDHNYFIRLDRLYNNLPSQMSEEQQLEYESLDQIRERGMLVAENKCRRLKMGARKWSPTLQMAIDKHKYLKLSLSRMKGSRVNARTLIRLSRKCGYSCLGMTEEELCKERDTAYKDYKKVKKNHRELRNTFLEDLAEAWEKAGKGKKHPMSSV